MTTTCVDLHALFPEYRVFFEDGTPKRSRFDPWAVELRGKRGTVYPHGAASIAVSTTNRAAKADLLALHGSTMTQDGDEEWSFVFPVEQFSVVADVCQLRKKRIDRPEVIARRIEGLRRNRENAV